MGLFTVIGALGGGLVGCVAGPAGSVAGILFEGIIGYIFDSIGNFAEAGFAQLYDNSKIFRALTSSTVVWVISGFLIYLMFEAEHKHSQTTLELVGVLGGLIPAAICFEKIYNKK